MTISSTEAEQYPWNQNKKGMAETRNCANLALKSSPGFREKLAEREEAMPLGRVLFNKDFFKDLNICTIKIWLEMQP